MKWSFSLVPKKPYPLILWMPAIGVTSNSRRLLVISQRLQNIVYTEVWATATARPLFVLRSFKKVNGRLSLIRQITLLLIINLIDYLSLKLVEKIAGPRGPYLSFRPRFRFCFEFGNILRDTTFSFKVTSDRHSTKTSFRVVKKTSFNGKLNVSLTSCQRDIQPHSAINFCILCI